MFMIVSSHGKENVVTAVFHQHHFYYPVEIAWADAPPLTGFPWIKPSNMLTAIAKNHDLDHFLGGVSLQNAEPRLLSFWSKYRSLFAEHQLWDKVDANRMPLSRCIPILLHGDEGVTYKKNGLLVVSLQRAWGHGSSKSKTAIRLNFLRTGFQTRVLIICVCHKARLGFDKNMFSQYRYFWVLRMFAQEKYAEDKRVWNATSAAIAC